MCSLWRVLRDSATLRRVKSHLVGRWIVHSLDNINFAIVRPIRANGPVSWPYAAAMRHRKYVSDEQSAIVRLLGANANAKFFTWSYESHDPLVLLTSHGVR